MAVYLVTWDLNKEKPNYAQARANFIALLDKFTSRKDSGLDSVRFVESTSSAQEIVDYLRKAQDGDDTLFVTKLHTGTSERAGWMNQDTRKWIEARQ